MACIGPSLQIDDQSLALRLQLEEIEAQRELQSGKWTQDSPPDFALAFDDFEVAVCLELADEVNHLSHHETNLMPFVLKLCKSRQHHYSV